MPGMDEVLAARRAARASRSQSRANVVAVFIFLVSIIIGVVMTAGTQNPGWLIIWVLAGLFLSQSPKIAKQWERAVVLRLGKYTGLRGPGLFWITPFVETISIYIDQRVVTTSFAAEETLTSDTVPVNVDAVLFWMVHDSEKAALEVQDFSQAVSWAAQTGLRDIIGRTSLTELLRGREKIEAELQALIDQRSNPWGVTVQSVEMRDIVIPTSLQDAMSREAQASREKSARIILGQAEVEIAQLFFEAAKSYENNPTALHLRAMNILYEGLKEKGALMVVPSNVVESMGLGGMMGAGWPSERSLVTKRCPSDTRSISIAIASTDASNRSSLWAVSVNAVGGSPGRLDFFQIIRAAANASGNQIKTTDSTESVIISFVPKPANTGADAVLAKNPAAGLVSCCPVC